VNPGSFRARLAACAALAAALQIRSGGQAAPFDDGLHVLPRPAHVSLVPDCAGLALQRGLRVPSGLDPSALTLVDERWQALGINGRLRSDDRDGAPRLLLQTERTTEPAQSYRLDIDTATVRVAAPDPDGVFYAFATLAQLAQRDGAGVWRLPCVHVVDAPALRWRILSDDVSRGPLPTMRYFEERIRTIAAFKMNGYSPYMEHVFVDPKHPLPAPLDGITGAELHALDAYARRFHVALIPEQQTFAHMHQTLRWERYATLAETPHGYLLSPENPAGEAYVRDLIGDELAVVPRAPFFHIGSDEPLDLGRGRSKALVEARGEGVVYAQHVLDTAKFVIARSGARPMLWDDALERHPELLAQLPKSLVFVNWHYGSEPSYQPFIDRIARGGFEQMVAPGSLNWNQLYPDLQAAFANIGRFVDEGKGSHVLGLFQTVWHDDGETLFEATWFPVLYAAASAWQSTPVDPDGFRRDVPAAFFGSDAARYADDLAALGRCGALLRAGSPQSGDELFWADPFAPAAATDKLDLAAIRLAAESVLERDRLASAPPLHAQAAAVMTLAALRYDLLARQYQIAAEARASYDDAVANAGGAHDETVSRDLNLTKYLFWEERDRLLELEPLVRSAWEYEDRAGHELSVLERYHLTAQRAIARADRIDAVSYRYAAGKTLPNFDEALGLR